MTIRTKAIIVFQLDPSFRVPGVVLPVQFNPTELSDGYSAIYNQQTNSTTNGKNFVQTTRDKFQLKLYYDASDAVTPVLRNVLKQTLPLRELLTPTVLFPDVKVPPLCTFIWGTFIYRGNVTSYKENFSYFTPEGFPMRAEVNLTFDTVEGQEAAKENGMSKNSRVIRTVKEGDRLDVIAFDIYGDATLWPLIADANNILDPIGFPTADDLGQTIAIPEL